MKILKQAHRLGRYLCGLTLALMPLVSDAQDCMKSISYSILESRTFQVPQGTDVSDLNAIDLLKGKTEQRIKHLDICIQDGGWLEMTTTFEHKEKDPFRKFPVSRSVLNRDGMTTYDIAGKVLYHRPADQLKFTPGVQTALDPEAINSFGKSQAIETLDPSQLAPSNDAFIWQEGSKTYLTQGTTEALVDSESQYVLQNNFKAGQLMSSQFNAYQESNGVSHPTVKLNRSYQPLSNGARLQVSHEQRYFAFSLKENGKEMASFRTDQNDQHLNGDRAYNLGFYDEVKRKAPTMHVSPNPATNLIQVKVGGRLFELGGDLIILTAEGRIVHQENWKPRQSEKQFSLDDLAPGVYFIQIKNEHFDKNQKFIKL